jgi:hypothetical protein
MRRNSKVLAHVLIAGVAIVSMVQTASAACGSMAGVWHFHALHNSPGGVNTTAIRCVATVAASGEFTGPCRIFEAGTASPFSTNVSGTFTKTAACDLTGSVAIPGDPNVIIRFGHINGNIATGIATQGTGASLQVLYFSLVRK